MTFFGSSGSASEAAATTGSAATGGGGAGAAGSEGVGGAGAGVSSEARRREIGGRMVVFLRPSAGFFVGFFSSISETVATWTRGAAGLGAGFEAVSAALAGACAGL